MEDLNYLFRLLATSQVILLTGYFLIYERHRAGYLAALCTTAFICYLLLPFSRSVLGDWTILPVIFATMIPSLLWLLVHWFFRDERDIPLWLLLLTLVYLIFWLLPDAWQLSLIANEDIRLLFFSLLPQLAKLGLVVHVVYMAIAGLNNDLVGQRRKLRVLLAIGAGSLTSLVIIVEIWSRGPTPLMIEALGAMLMFVLALAVNLYLLGLRADAHLKPLPTTPSRVANATDELIPKITHVMVTERFYANQSITLADLAEHLKTPIHRLRDVINKSMGYRNFNQFLNHYRIQEAAQRLREEQKLPILTIALDTGFKSLSSFNTAFRQTHGMTPTEWRRQAN